MKIYSSTLTVYSIKCRRLSSARLFAVQVDILAAQFRVLSVLQH